MRQAYATLERAAKGTATVLVRGESGTGKELVARAIHDASPRAAHPFVKIDCTSLPENLLESELFGYEKGAFTGAVARKLGRVELADKGTLFLDEIGELALPLQAKLLRLLQDRQFERLGGTKTIRVDVRIVAATHRDLETMIERDQFRVGPVLSPQRRAALASATASSPRRHRAARRTLLPSARPRIANGRAEMAIDAGALRFLREPALAGQRAAAPKLHRAARGLVGRSGHHARLRS